MIFEEEDEWEEGEDEEWEEEEWQTKPRALNFYYFSFVKTRFMEAFEVDL